MNPTAPPAPIVPQVSAILIGYNQAGALRRAIEALERSTNREHLEILLVDAASTDETGSLDQQYPGLTVLRLPDHFGATKALNIATRTARGDLLFYLSPEVDVAPDTIAKLREKLEAATDTAAVCPLLMSPDGNPVWRAMPLPTREIFSQVCKRGALPFTAAPDLTVESVVVAYPALDAVMVRRHLIAGMNYFDQRLGEFWADADLALRIRRAGKKIRVYPEICATYHAASASRQPAVAETSDRIVGAAVLLGKYSGFFAGAAFRVGAILKALFSFNLPLFFALLSGRKMDASQAG
jgi:GT2 family glycosyltransferase